MAGKRHKAEEIVTKLRQVEACGQTTQPTGAGTAPHAGWMSISAIPAKLEGQGYVVRENDTDDGVYEVQAPDKNGARVESDIDPATGEPVRGWKQDD